MSLHRRVKHPEYVEGCFGCKVGTISFGVVPGASQDSKLGFSRVKDMEQDLHTYREKRRAGEQPDGIRRDRQRRSARKQDIWERRENDLRNDNPPEVVEKIKKSLTNK